MNILIPVIIVTAIGFIAGIALSLAAKFMAVEIDEKQEKIRECLPGANCGACGYSGCDGYAAAIASGEATPDKCAPGGDSTANGLAEILGVEISSTPKIAFIACGGNCESSALKYNYQGFESCAAANLVHSGPLECEYGCIGFGDCIKACVFGAIEIKNGRPVVCSDLCAGCGKCTDACPKSLIRLVNKDTKTFVNCSSKAKAAVANKECKLSCIGCKLCEKVCENGAITVNDNLAVIDREKCTDCGKCKEVCRRGVII